MKLASGMSARVGLVLELTPDIPIRRAAKKGGLRPGSPATAAVTRPSVVGVPGRHRAAPGGDVAAALHLS